MQISKIVLTTVLLYVLVICNTITQAQPEMNAPAIGLKGKVRVVTKGWVAEKDNLRHIITVRKYDRRGNEIEVTSYGKRPLEKTSTPMDKSVYVMKDGVKTERSYHVSTPSMLGRMTIAGIVVNGKVQPLPPPPPPPMRESDGAILRQGLIKQDVENRRIEITWHKRLVKDSPVSYRIVYQLDKEGRIEEELFYDADKSQPSRSVYKYNEQGIEIEFSEYDSTGALHIRNAYSDFKLDPQGNWIERTATMFYVRSSDGQSVNTSDKQYREISYYPSAR